MTMATIANQPVQICMWVGGPREERDMYPHPIIEQTCVLLRNVIFLKFYEEVTSLKRNTQLLMHLICRWDHDRQAIRVNLNLWYQPMEKDIYVITSLSRRGEDFPHYHNPLPNVGGESPLVYVQRYVSANIIDPNGIQVVGGQSRLHAFDVDEVRCLSLMAMTLAHYTF